MNHDELPTFEKFSRRNRRKTDALPKAKRRATGCVHKKIYRTASFAQKVAAKQIRAGVPYLRAYHCACGFWHLTHHTL
jgi:hypothetical protein